MNRERELTHLVELKDTVHTVDFKLALGSIPFRYCKYDGK